MGGFCSEVAVAPPPPKSPPVEPSELGLEDAFATPITNRPLDSPGAGLASLCPDPELETGTVNPRKLSLLGAGFVVIGKWI